MQEQKEISLFSIFSLIGFTLFTTTVVNARVIETTAVFPLPPRFSANSYASDYTVGQADLMLPMAGDRRHNFYLDPDIAYGTDNQGYGDLGLGYRWVQNDEAILGLYAFGGYSRIENNARIWVANPGIEALGSRWDAHLNGYFVMGDRSTIVSDSFTFNRFTGHTEIDDDFQTTQYAGNGADVKLGYQLFPGVPLKGYVGSYFFAPPNTDNIWGGAVGLEYWLVPYLKVFASYTYDDFRRSTGALGLGIEFGGTRVHRSDPTLEERITDPVERYLAELGRGSAIPARNNSQILNNIPVLNNIAFFSQTGTPNNGGISLTLANCTFESPCGPTDFSQTGVNTLSTLLPSTTMYFNGGSYPAVSTGTNPITLASGQSVHSRITDYSQPATGVARSTFNGAFSLSGHNTLENIILLPVNTGPGSISITAAGTDNLITGSQIGNAISNAEEGINLLSGSQTLINESEIFAQTVDIRMVNATAIIQNSVLTDTNTALFSARGVTISGGSAQILNTAITVSSTFGGGGAIGIETVSSGISQVNNVQLTVIGASVTAGNATGLVATGNAINTTNNSRISVSATPPAIANISAEGLGGVVNINNSTCIVNGTTMPCP